MSGDDQAFLDHIEFITDAVESAVNNSEVADVLSVILPEVLVPDHLDWGSVTEE